MDNHTQQLALLVRDMRNAQRQYFRSRDADALAKAKRYELTVDQAVANILATERQPQLFDTAATPD